MKDQNPEKEKRNNGTDQFQPNGDSKQAMSFEVSPETIGNNVINILEVRAWPM
ncbi:MAG: hypothetical protein ACM3UY_05380 [Methanocella sp.]|jgi:hypothetical protein